jgi:hypothetical protein
MGDEEIKGDPFLERMSWKSDVADIREFASCMFAYLYVGASPLCVAACRSTGVHTWAHDFH